MFFLFRLVPHRALLPAIVLLLVPRVVFAHPGRAPQPHDLWSTWTLAPAVLLGIVLTSALYVRGWHALCLRMTRASASLRSYAYCYAAAMFVLTATLVSPIDGVSGALFSVHMVQHLLLTVVAAPLLVLSNPPLMMLWVLPAIQRRAVTQWWMHAIGGIPHVVWRTLTTPFVAWCIHLVFLWMWHLPTLYDAAVRDERLHVAEHVMFLASALLFWWVALDRRRMRLGAAALYLFGASLQCTLLGAALTVARTPWFFVHYGTTQAWGLTALEDQQLAGLIMWIPASMVYLIALLPRVLPHLRERQMAASH